MDWKVALIHAEKVLRKGNNMIQDKRERLLDAMLHHVPFDGWSKAALMRAGQDIQLSEAEIISYFPDLESGTLALFMQRLDEAMQKKMQSLPLGKMKLHEKVRAAVRARFEASEPHKEAVRRALTYYSLPHHAPKGLERLYKTVDAIWRAAGDSPTDFSFYTKRLTLAGVYSSTLVYWLNDDSTDLRKTFDFLDKRLKDVLKFNQAKGKLKTFFNHTPFSKTTH